MRITLPRLLFTLLMLSLSFHLTIKLNQVHAATINVTTTVDTAADGQCSLREAIDAANTNAAVDSCTAGDDSDSRTATWGTFNGDIVSIPSGTYTLTLAGADDTNAAGDLDVLSNIFFIGNPSGTILDASAIAGAGERALHILPASTYVYLESLDITRGAGGISSNGTYLQTWNISVWNNTAATNGGGIYSTSTDAIINNSWVGNNAATNGGGIYAASGSIAIVNVYTSGNTSSADGAGIYISSGVTARIGMGTTVIGNNASGMGGGIYNAGTVQAWSTSDFGFSVMSNTAVGDGGGIANDRGATFTTPTAPIYGYGLNIIDGNSTEDDGGGIYNDGTVNLYRTYIGNNTATSQGGYGGGIYDQSPRTINMWDSWIDGNSAVYAGGIYIQDGSITAVRSAFTSNSASSARDGIYIESGSGSLTNSTVSGNDEKGIVTSEVSSLELNFVTISGHTNYGIFTGLGDTIVLSRSILDDPCEFSNASVTSGGYNIETGNTCGLSNSTDTRNASPSELNLGSLDYYGGYNPTYELREGSIAIDYIPSAQCSESVDQRGETRPDPVGTLCDSGAYELQQEPELPETGISIISFQILGVLLLVIGTQLLKTLQIKQFR